MDRNAWWKWLVLAGLLAFSLWVVTPPFDQKDADGVVVKRGKIRLGLDLKGGTSFTLKVDEEQLRRNIRAHGESLTDEEVEAEVRKTLDGAQSRALEVIRNRVDALGVEEPIIYPGKDNRIVVQLPGTDEAKRKAAKDMLAKLAFLEFRMVHEKNDELVRGLFEKNLVPPGYRLVTVGTESFYARGADYKELSKDPDYRVRLGRFNAPPGHELMLQRERKQEQEVYRPCFVKVRYEISGENLKNASVDYGGLAEPVVKIQFDGSGAKKFAQLTSDFAPGGARNQNPNSYRQLAIVLDGQLYSAPVIREAIYGGKAEISGSFTQTEANFLANVLRAGSLPAPITFVEERFVAPSLGQDSINSGVRAALLGGIAVVVFMAAYYLVSGVIADLALALNLLLLPLGMILASGFLGIFAKDAAGGGPIQLPVLTLPGIAGIVLTVGMAVDANVLIFERIREEVKAGKRLWTAITAGYDRAFVTILDANLTTLLTAVILFILGSGPIRGFAVTLSAGIVVSMFTALVVTKLIFGVLARKAGPGLLKMLTFVKETKVDFIKWRNLAVALSVAVIVVTWAVMLVRGARLPSSVLGVDFTGGAAVTLSFEKRVPNVEVRRVLEGAGLRDLHVQYQRELGEDAGEFLLVKASGDEINGRSVVDVIKDETAKAFPAAGFKDVQEESVGPQVGRELKSRAVWSIVWALAGIIVYIAWRFEFGFALGAIVALVHDVLITVGVYACCGRQLSLPVIAALLTIVGYSVNDTIVVFDRIREDLRLDRTRTFKEICNLSINQTLSRTLLTSLTTLLTVIMLLFFGGGAINDFALTLFVGIVAGTYSTVYIATPVVLAWHRDRRPEMGAATKATV